MNSMIAANINGNASINQKVASGSRSSLLSSSIDFNLTDIRTNFSAPCHQGKYLVKLSGKEVLLNGQNKNQNCDQNKNPIENSYVSINGNKEKTAEDSIPTPKVQLYTGKIHVEWSQVYKIGAGLNNLGNTCFMNTVIQCLTYCPPLANYLLHDNDHSSKCTITGFCMMCLLQRHIKRAIGKTGEVIKPLDVYQRLKLIAKHFQFGRQEDAHEFLRYVIDHLWKSCLPQTNGVTKLDPSSKETTVINKIFGGYHRSQVICLRCKKESNTFDHFMDFILDIKQNVMTLEKALEKFIQPELLQQENSYKCPKCKMKVEAQKRFSVYRAPTVATFQLKRFDYNRSFGGKITKQVTYPEKLNLRPYMSDPQGDPVWYRLNAVLVHSGPSCTSGHYYCYVKNSNGFWYIMDDQRVHQVSLNQVLNQSAYVLFYIKIESGDRAPLKKCIDNKNSFMKGSVPNSHFSKVPEMNNLKPNPLSEKVSPFANSKQQFSSPTQIKKFNFSTPNREKISFGFRTAVSSGPFNSPKSKVLSSAPASTTSGGLVPYVEDSSESSDASESNQPVTKQNSTPDSECKQNVKNGSLNNYTSSPRLEIKAKLSKSVFNNSAHSFSNAIPKVSTTNPVPKMSATGSWTVTDATETTSSSSSTGVNSTTDWHVTSAVNVKSSDSPKMSESKDYCENGSANSSKLLPMEVPTAKPSANTNEDSDLSQNVSKPMGQENSPSQKSNFRKQQQKFKSYFLENEEATENSFKRKSSDSYSKVAKDSPITEHSEIRYSPVPKKVKYTEKTSYMNGDIDLHTNLDISDRDNNCASLTQQRQYSTSNCDNSSRTHTSKDTSLHENSSGVPTNSKSSSSFSTVSESEKARISPEKDSVFPKVKHKERSSFSEASKSAQYEKKVSPIFNHLKRDTSLYGTEVPTWRGDNVYRPSVVPSHDNRRSFDDYDNEFDRGKVRKSKMKDHHYQYFHRKTPFQKHTDRYHNKYNGKFYNNHRSHKKPYDSHYNWKPNHDNYQRYRNHHQRRY